MFDRMTRGFRLLRESGDVLLSDPAMLLFPVCSAVASLVVSATFIVPLFLAGAFTGFLAHGAEHPAATEAVSNIVVYGVLFLAYAVNYFVVIFFNVGLLSAARAALRGERATFASGIAAALDRVGTIASWALFAATVGIVLKVIQDRTGSIGRIVGGILGVAWSIGTALVVPIIAFERVGPIEAVKRSAGLIKRTWGETLVGGVSLGVLGMASILVCFAIVAGGFMISPTAGLAGIGLAVMLFILSLTIQSALRGIFEVALYSYVAEGVVPPAISQDLVTAAYRAK